MRESFSPLLPLADLLSFSTKYNIPNIRRTALDIIHGALGFGDQIGQFALR